MLVFLKSPLVISSDSAKKKRIIIGIIGIILLKKAQTIIFDKIAKASLVSAVIFVFIKRYVIIAIKNKNIGIPNSKAINKKSLKAVDTEIAYINVFNTSRWRTIDWGRIKKGKTVFRNLGVHLVYLPSTYQNNKMNFESYPVLLKKGKKIEQLKPNYQETFDFTFNKDNKTGNTYKDYNSLDVQDGKSYSLFMWDSRWKKIGEAIAIEENISFENVPTNGLFFVKPKKNSDGYERIFIVNAKNDKITWY